MNVSHFFIDRPIFAWVIAIIISLAGGLSIFTLPISKYPEIAPPTIQVLATYTGASAKTVEDSITQVVEQRMKGLDHLLYMTSTSDSLGNAMIKLTFETGTNADIAQVQVQNKLQQAMPLLPEEVQRLGVRVQKSSSSFLMIASFISKDGSMDNVDLSDYVASNVMDPVSRLDGVGDVQLFGGAYAMRIWLDPNKLFKYNLTPVDVVAAIQEQNVQVSAGQIGGTPSIPTQQINATITVQSRLQTVDQFENILLRVNQDGSRVFLKDVSQIAIGTENYNFIGRYNDAPTTGLAISLAPGGNAMETSQRVRDQLAELEHFFPPGMSIVYPYDTSPFVKASIEEVRKTLFEAILLVFIVMFVFLQSIRATLIPMIAVPVVLLGTFGFLAAFGFSINMLTMFAMVLAIGLLVDDAIVVVENVERLMTEEGLSPRDAARKSMTQITGALMGVVMVLCAAFVPMAFFGGATGVIYRQFSVTLVSALVLSFFVAIILTPALCATMLKQEEEGHKNERTDFFGWFNHFFDVGSKTYQNVVAFLLKRSVRVIMMVVFVGLTAAVALMLINLPTSFLPEEDQGAVMGMVQLPAGSTQAQTLEVLQDVTKYYREEESEAVDAVMAVAGFSFAGTGQNMAFFVVQMKDWDARAEGVIDRIKRAFGKNPNKSLSVSDVVARGNQALARRDALVMAFVPPAIPELGIATGFDMFLQDRAGLGHDALMQARNQFLGEAAQSPLLTAVRPNGMDDTPQLKFDIDQVKAQSFGLTQSMINSTMSAAWGSSYVNDFVDRGRVKRVYVQAEPQYRMMPEDIKSWYVRNANGEMVPFSTFTSSRWEYASPRLERFNGFPAMEIQGEPKKGVSSGDAMSEVEKIAGKLVEGVGIEWTGMSYQERAAGATQMLLYALSIIVVFLCLAALYESWSIPFSVILVIPVGVLGLIAAVWLRDYANDIYFKVALLTIIGLSAKNAILIVEFAKEAQVRGKELVDATLEAVHIRLRPILMTSLAFGFGVLPMALSTGAGAGAQNVIGTGVVGGMITTTMLGIFFTPVFFVVIRSIFKYKPRHIDQNKETTEPPTAVAEGK